MLYYRLYYSQLLDCKIPITVSNFFLDDKYFLKSVAKHTSQKMYQLNHLKICSSGTISTSTLAT